jgi:ABC-type glycerol-3-phosphate transport system substrate-binding protein
MKKLICFSVTVLICLTLVSTLAFAKKEESPEAKVMPFEGTEITVIYMSGGYADAARAVAEDFKEMTGASVTVVDYPWGGLHEKMFAELIAGTGNFDVICVAGQWLGEIAPYTEDISKFIESNDVIADFQKSSYDSFNFGGVQLAFPYQTDVYSVFYRTDIFKENGIEPDPDWTWDEYIATAKKLTKGGMYGTSLAGVKHQQMVYYMNRYWGLGGKTTTPDWKVTMDNSTAIKALELLKDTYTYTSPKAAGGDISEMNNVFLSGNEVAMLEGWPSLIFGLLDDPNASNVIGKWSVLPTPGDGPVMASLWGIGISKDSKNKEAAYELVKFYTSRENQLFFWEEFGMIPVRKSIWEDPDVHKVRPYAANYGMGLSRAKCMWQISASTEGWEGVLNDEVSKYLSDQQSASQTINNIQKQWTELLKRKPAPDGYMNPE